MTAIQLSIAAALLALAGCSQSVEIRAQGSHATPGGEPVQWVARYCATR